MCSENYRLLSEANRITGWGRYDDTFLGKRNPVAVKAVNEQGVGE